MALAGPKIDLDRKQILVFVMSYKGAGSQLVKCGWNPKNNADGTTKKGTTFSKQKTPLNWLEIYRQKYVAPRYSVNMDWGLNDKVRPTVIDDKIFCRVSRPYKTKDLPIKYGQGKIRGHFQFETFNDTEGKKNSEGKLQTWGKTRAFTIVAKPVAIELAERKRLAAEKKEKERLERLSSIERAREEAKRKKEAERLRKIAAEKARIEKIRLAKEAALRKAAKLKADKEKAEQERLKKLLFEKKVKDLRIATAKALKQKMDKI